MSEAEKMENKLREHVIGPTTCPKCGQSRNDNDYDLCDQELMCSWGSDYGTHSDAFTDPWQAKKDMLEAAALIRQQAATIAELQARLKQDAEDNSEMLLIAHLGGLTKNREARAKEIAVKDAEIERLRGALAWYGENARLARLIHREGDAGRHNLAEDGGKRARTALGGSDGQ